MMTVRYKVTKRDYTTLLGIIVYFGNEQYCFIPKEDIQKYNYTNVKFSSRGQMRISKEDMKNVDFITKKDWRVLQTYESPTCTALENNLERVRHLLWYSYLTDSKNLLKKLGRG